MFHFLGFIFFIVLIILTIGFFILWRIVNTFLGLGKRMGRENPNTQNQRQNKYERNKNASQENNDYDSHRSSSSQGNKKKIFDDDEGEYIDFEEFKD